MCIAPKLTRGLFAAAVAVLSAIGGDGAVVCLGADGHVGVVGVHGGACDDHGAPHDHETAFSTRAKSCTDIPLPAGLAVRTGRPHARAAESLWLAALPAPDAPATDPAACSRATPDALPPGATPPARAGVVVLLI